MRDAKAEKAVGALTRGSGEWAAKPQARKLGAVSAGEAARLARIESLGRRRAGASASIMLFGSAFICMLLAALLFLPARGGASMAEGPRLASREASPPSGTPSWSQIAHPTPLFSLDAAELSNTERTYEAVRSTFGNGREDRLVFGVASRADKIFMEVAISNSGNGAGDAAPFFVDLSRRAAAAGVAVAKASPGEPLLSRFGEMESAETRLSANGVERSCLAFRRAVPGEALRLLGWYCPPEGTHVLTSELSCLIDRLEISGNVEDEAVREAFASARARRLECKALPAAASTVVGKGSPSISASAASMEALLETIVPRPRGTKPRRRRIP